MLRSLCSLGKEVLCSNSSGRVHFWGSFAVPLTLVRFGFLSVHSRLLFLDSTKTDASSWFWTSEAVFHNDSVLIIPRPAFERDRVYEIPNLNVEHKGRIHRVFAECPRLCSCFFLACLEMRKPYVLYYVYTSKSCDLQSQNTTLEGSFWAVPEPTRPSIFFHQKNVKKERTFACPHWAPDKL